MSLLTDNTDLLAVSRDVLATRITKAVLHTLVRFVKFSLF